MQDGLTRYVKFLSTPSARRATFKPEQSSVLQGLFLSTPSARRATGMPLGVEPSQQISIHALREEGDTSTAPSASSW